MMDLCLGKALNPLKDFHGKDDRIGPYGEE